MDIGQIIMYEVIDKQPINKDVCQKKTQLLIFIVYLSLSLGESLCPGSGSVSEVERRAGGPRAGLI